MERPDGPIAPQLAAGDLLGPYRIERELGQGGMAEVYRARDTRLGRTVALKLLRSEFACRGDFRHRFEREARAISALNHPHICSLYDVGEQGGFAYLVMEHVEGETLAQILTRGPVPVERALEYAIEIADALRTAHSHGTIHRDLKPGNIMIAETGVKVLDFGLAKLSEGAAAADAESTLTETAGTRAGEILGTVAYMSPEQAEGKPLDARTDVFSLGIVLYEMLCGQRPFKGDSHISTLAAILRETPETPRRARPEIPPELEQIVLRCLEKRPEDRYGSADDVHTALQSCQHSLSGRTGEIPWRRPAVIVAVLAVTLAAGALGTRWFVRASRARWAERAAPEISRLMAESHPLAALRLLRQVEPYAASSPELIRLREQLALSPLSVATTPPGAEIYLTDYAVKETGDSSAWEFLGQSPLTTSRIPFGYYQFRVVKRGFVPIEQAATAPAALRFELHTAEETPGGMVWVAGTKKTARAPTFPALPAADIPAFWMDRYEVTNREFKEFVDRGGYRNREYWKQPFLKDGRTLSWEEAMAEFRDSTGRPGPATWELGTYPEGRTDYPVGGVSWYEAAAYAEFAGKSLPTVYHWYLGAGDPGWSALAVSVSNFAGRGPAAVGSYQGLGQYGTYDLAGNVKEWCWNLTGDRRYILGGGWNEPSYQFRTPDARRPFDREASFGFRCVKLLSPPAETLAGPVSFVSRDRRNDHPADDRAFRIFQGLHSYDKTDLKPAVEAHDESPPYWRTEDVTFQAAYGNERMLAHLYLPKNAAPPYQAVVFFGGVNFLTDQRIGAKSRLFDFVVRSGRAVIVPAYKGTLERGPGDYYHLLGEPNRWREMNLQQSKDLGRSIDYLETRPDIDARKLAFYGNSYGAAMAPHLVAVEPRIRCVVMMSGGSFEKVPAEVDSWNFAPRVKVPVLMVNGRDDFRFPLEASQLPLFRLLGTPAKDKRHVVRDGGHLNPAGRPDVMKEILDWLDRYLGSVQTR